MQGAFSFRFSGRTPRRSYWIGLLLMLVAGSALERFADALLRITIDENLWRLSQGLIAFAAVVCVVLFMALTVRRLHDIGRTGWWILLFMLPGIGTIGSFVLGFLSSAQGANQWGDNPYEGGDPSERKMRALRELADLKDRGVLTQQEFENEKKTIINK